MCQIKRKRITTVADMTSIIRISLWFILLSSCSTAYPTPIEAVTKLVNLTVIGRPATMQELHGVIAPFEEYTDKPNVVQKFQDERFVMVCPNHSDWTVLRNTSNGIRSKCEVVGTRRRIYGPICHISYLYPWVQGIYWCEHKDGMVTNLRNLTLTSGSLLLQPSVVPIMEGDDVVLTCRTPLAVVIDQQDPVRFYKDDMLLEERLGRRMTIRSFSSSHAGFYKCTIKTLASPIVWLEAKKPADDATESHLTFSSHANGLRSGSLSATVNGVPVMVNHAIIIAGQNLVFRCNNTENPSREMTVWGIRVSPFKGAQRCGYGSWGERIGAVCDIENAFPWDSGLYFCKSNEGESEAPLGLTVTVTRWRTASPRVVMLNRGSWQVPEGEVIILICKAANCLGGTWSIWMETAQGITRCGVTRGTMFRSACWIIVTWTDSGDFWCSSEDGHRGGQSTLTVVGVNSVIMDISPVPVATGDDVVLTCTLALSDILADETAVFYKDNVVVATLPRGYMVIRNFTDAQHRGYYKCEIPGYGESQHNLLTTEATGDICEMYNPDDHLPTRANPTTPTTYSRGVILDGWVIAILCVLTPLLTLFLYWIATILWRAIQRWRTKTNEGHVVLSM